MEGGKQQQLSNSPITSLKRKVRHFFADDFFYNPIVQWASLISLFMNVANWAGIAYFIRQVDFPIILHYNVYFGVDIIGDWKEAYYLPAAGTLILAINALLAFYFFQRKQRIAAHILLLAAMFVQAGISIAAASVILINY